MPIRIPDTLPAAETLKREGVSLLRETDATRQDIRPLQIGLLNLMPNKIRTETQFARLIGATPLQVELTLVRIGGHMPKNTSQEHLISFYQTWDEIRDRKFDGFIVTGAPVEQLPREVVVVARVAKLDGAHGHRLQVSSQRLEGLRGRITPDAEMDKITWFRAGGPAEVLFTPADEADLAAFLKATPKDIPLYVIGVGSNLLVRDGGVRGVLAARVVDDDVRAIAREPQRDRLADAARPAGDQRDPILKTEYCLSHSPSLSF